MAQGKCKGDISDSFASLLGLQSKPLLDRYRQLILALMATHDPQQLVDSWRALLAQLRQENEVISSRGPAVIPSIRYSHLDEDITANMDELKKRGVAVIRVTRSGDRGARVQRKDQGIRQRELPGHKRSGQELIIYFQLEEELTGVKASLPTSHRCLSSTGLNRSSRLMRTPICCTCSGG